MINIAAEGPMSTDYGLFRIYVFEQAGTNLEHIALAYNLNSKHQETLIRIHSACITGEIFRANNCDCREQLDAALKAIVCYGCGALLYMDQEGRGNGLTVKVKTFDLVMNHKMDPKNAFESLGYPGDLRDYTAAAEMLRLMGVDSPIKLLTNNPQKVEDLKKAGIHILERIDLYIPPHNELTKRDILSKRDELGHFFPAEIRVERAER